MTAMDAERTDIVIIGAGVVGCAIAMELARRGRDVMLLERERQEGTVTTSRNSGVVHSGLYYPPGSRKADACVRGQALLYAWAEQYGVAHRRCGKLVVARSAESRPALEALARNGAANGARGTELWSPTQVRAAEPALPEMTGALWCPHTGVIDAHAFTRSLRVEAERQGCTFAPQTDVTAIDTLPDGAICSTSRGPITATHIVNAAGLECDRIATWLGGPAHALHPCRGDYFTLRTPHSYAHLIYPLRDPQDPGLGVHLTIDLGGGLRLGPDATWVESREDYAPRDDKRGAFAEAASRLLGPIEPEQLTWAGAGIRPKLRGPEVAADHDFLVELDARGHVHLMGIESPGLTAALALAQDVAELLA